MPWIGGHPRAVFLRRPAQLALFLLVLTGVCVARPKKDVIVLTNGDRITCEIVDLQKGYLYIKTDYVDGTISVDWSKVARIESPQTFVVADHLAKRYSGALMTSVEGTDARAVTVEVTGPSATQTLSGKEIVEIDQTDTSAWQNVHGGIDFGATYTKQQNRIQYNLDANAAFRRTKWSINGDYSSNFSGGGDASNLRNDLQLTFLRQMRSPRNFYVGYAEFLHNGEQQLILRTTLGGGLGHYFVRTNNSLIGVLGGIVWTDESYSSAPTSGDNGSSEEVVLGTQLNFFRFKTTNVLVTAKVYPSLTELGRVRFDLDTSLKLRLAKNLYWKLTYYLNFDSQPPQTTSKADYGSTAGLGWTF